jgi:LruC domain-containing protein
MVKANLPSLFWWRLQSHAYKNGGTGANTILAFGYTKPITIVVNIILADRAITFRELNIGTVNPFMIVGTSVNGAPGSRSKEIHLANYKPSDLFDTSYFENLLTVPLRPTDVIL